MRDTRLDVVVLDLGLPGIDGMSFARELRDGSDIGLVIVTRQSAPEADGEKRTRTERAA